MNIKDLQPGSYSVVQPKKMNIKDLAPGSFSVVNKQSPQESIQAQALQGKFNAIQTPPEKLNTLGALLNPTIEGVDGLKTLYGGGEQGIARKLASDVKAGAQDIQKGGAYNVLKGVTKSGFRTAGDVAGTIYAPIGAAIGATGIGKATEMAGEYIANTPLMNKLTDIKAVQDFAIKHPNAGEDFTRGLNLVPVLAEKGTINPKTALPRTIEQVKTGIKTVEPAINSIKTGANDVVAAIKENRSASKTNKVAGDIKQIQNKYSDLRKQNQFSKDYGESSRQRIARTDVLVGAVDETGLIRTKEPGGAVDKYKAQTISNTNQIGRKMLEKEGATVPLTKVELQLKNEVSKSGLEGADLTNALNGVKKEMSGLRKRADAQGNIKLEILHDAKINTTDNINYSTPKESAKARKAQARAYKDIIEANSKTKIGEVNKELSKYLGDIEILESLDGKRVAGGKLGKYTAQIGGRIAGGAVGGFIGGVPGVVAGTIAGGEVASKLSGRSMAKTFGKERGNVIKPSKILQEAVNEVKKPKAPILQLPSPKSGAP